MGNPALARNLFERGHDPALHLRVGDVVLAEGLVSHDRGHRVVRAADLLLVVLVDAVLVRVRVRVSGQREGLGAMLLVGLVDAVLRAVSIVGRVSRVGRVG